MAGISDFYGKLSDQERKILYVALGFIVLAVFDFLFLQPVSSKLRNLDRDIIQTKTDIHRDIRFLSYQQKIIIENDLYKVYQTDEKKTEEEIIASFLKTIENLGREAEVVVGKLNPGEAVVKKGYVQYFADVECNGTLEKIIKFVHKIDTTNNLLKVVKMNVIAKKTSADEVTVSMKISKLIMDAKANGSDVATAQAIMEGKLPIPGGSPISGGSPNSNAGGKGRSKETGMGAKASLKSGGGSSSGESGGSGGVGGGIGLGSESIDDSRDAGASRDAGEGTSASGSGGTGAKADGGSGGVRGGGGGGDSGESGGVESKDIGSESRVGSGSGGGAAGDDGDLGGKDEAKGDMSDAGSDASQSQRSSLATTKKDVKMQQKQEPAQDVQLTPTAKKIPPLNVNSGQRMKVSGIEELWNNFWGIKPKPLEPAQPRKSPEFNSKEYKTKDELEPNLWERMLHKK